MLENNSEHVVRAESQRLFSIWYLQVVDTAYSKVRKSALANSINLGCQKHFWRAISAGRVLGVRDDVF